MALTVQQIFDRAIFIMDEQSSTGSTDTTDTSDYKSRTVGIINTLIQECYPYSDTFTRPKKANRRGVADFVTSMDDEVDLDDYICGSVMPHGLASYLLSTEDKDLSNFFYQRYQELLMKARDGVLAESEDIFDVYAPSGHSIGFDRFSHW